MMKYLSILCFCAIFVAACNNETIIGEDLLSEENINLAIIDTIEITTSLVQAEPLNVFEVGEFSSTNPQTFPIGRSEDQFFGTTEVVVYIDIHKNAETPDFTDATLDSAILILPYDTLSAYGNPEAMHRFEVFPLTESMFDLDTLRTNTALAYESMPIGVYEGTARTRDSVFVYSPEVDSVQRLIPQLRVRLDENFSTDLFNFANGVENDTTIVENYFGFAIKTTPDDDSFVAFNLNNTLSFTRELAVYYTHQDGTKDKYDFLVGIKRSYQDIHDYTGSDVESALNDPTFADSLVFVQGLEGINIEIDLADIMNVPDIDLNSAELEFYVADLMGDDLDKNAPVPSFGLSYENNDGNITVIEDYFWALQTTSQSVFGGILEEENGLQKYKMGITTHLLNILNGEVTNTKIILSPVLKQNRLDRSILLGPGNSMFPANLKLIVTKN